MNAVGRVGLGFLPRERQLRDCMRALALAGLLATQPLLAGSGPASSNPCRAATPREAESLADRLYEKRDYQHAGECYEAAGDASHAQLAYLKAVGPNSEVALRELKDESTRARTLAGKVAQAFRHDH